MIIAAPTDAHAKWCFEAINAAFLFLVEKPLSTDPQEVEDVAAAALDAGVPFTVGFVERFNPAVRTVEGIVEDPIYFNAVRHSPYVPRIRTGVGGDLMIHDIDLALRLVRLDPCRSSASLANVHPSSESGAEDIAEIHIRFANGAVASLSANRTAQRKIRSLTVANLEIAAEIDLMRQDITIYRHVLSAAITEDLPGYRQETIMEIPQLRFRIEPLVAQLDHFIDLLAGRVDPAEEAEGVLMSHRVLAASLRSAERRQCCRDSRHLIVRIAVVNNFFPPRTGGSAHLSEALARELAKRGHDVLVITAQFGDAPAKRTQHGYRVVRLPAWYLPKTTLTFNFDINFVTTPRNVRRVFGCSMISVRR